MRHAVKLGVIVLAVAVLAMSGLALAQTDDTPDEQNTTAPDRTRGILDHLAPLVEEGVISQEQAEAVAEHLSGLQADRAARRHELHQQRRADRQEILDLLGVTVDDIKAAAEGGKSLADVAADQGVDIQDVIDLKTSQIAEHLADAVAGGRLTQDEADDKLAMVTEKISDAVNKPLNEHRPGRPSRRGGPELADAGAPAFAGALVLPPSATV